jgi:hypothetical protein
MTTAAGWSAEAWGGTDVSIEELARRQGVRPIASADDLVRTDTFASDEELDEFLADLHKSRHLDVG